MGKHEIDRKVPLRRMDLGYDFLMEAIAETALPYWMIGTEDGHYYIHDRRVAVALVESGLIKRVPLETKEYTLVDQNLQKALHRLQVAMRDLSDWDVTGAMEAQVAVADARKALKNSELEFWTPKCFRASLDHAESSIGVVMRRILEHGRQYNVKSPDEVARVLGAKAPKKADALDIDDSLCADCAKPRRRLDAVEWARQ